MDMVSQTQLHLFPSWWWRWQPGQPVFKVPVPAYGLGQVPLLLPLVLSPSHLWVKSETKQLLPNGMGQSTRPVLLKAMASTSDSPWAALWVISPPREKGNSRQRVCWRFHSISRIAKCKSTVLGFCAKYWVALRYCWLKVSHTRAELPTDHMQENLYQCLMD